LRIARPFGIDVRIHSSLFVVLAAVVLWSGASWFSALSLAVGLFGSVVLHELGHALMARFFGIQTAHITLYPFGGIAAIVSPPKTPWQEFWIAIAGPLVNVAIAVVVLPLGLLAGSWSLLSLAALNVGMAVFNLLPAFPMDGGRVLRALLSTRLGHYRASRVAIAVGSVFAVAFVLVGLLSWNPSLILVGGFLMYALVVERRRLAAAQAYGARGRHAHFVRLDRRPL